MKKTISKIISKKASSSSSNSSSSLKNKRLKNNYQKVLKKFNEKITHY